MAPRPITRRERNNDYSAVGTAGRRTGVTLPQGRLDENGLEEITGLFSSPVKPSPAKQNPGASNNDAQNSTFEASEDMSGIDSSGLTPTQTLSARRSLRAPALPPPRSVSPRKSGISGSARRSNGIDIRSPAKAFQLVDVENHETTPSPTPIRVKPRRFIPSPDKRPLEEIVTNGEATTSKQMEAVEESTDQHISAEGRDGEDGGAGQSEHENRSNHSPGTAPDKSDRITTEKPNASAKLDDSVQNPMGDEEMEEFLSGIDNVIRDALPMSDQSVEIAEKGNERSAQSIEPTQRTVSHQMPTAPPKNTRKRKSDEIENQPAATSSNSPAAVSTKKPAKKPRAAKAENSKAKEKQKVAPTAGPESYVNSAALTAGLKLMPERLPGMIKDANTHLSQRQQAELDQIIEKVKARPGKLKTLYVLKREKTKKGAADDLRTGRTVVKPLAYWSAEQCVYNGGGEAAAAASGLELGTRIPLNSITEITHNNRKTNDDSEDEDEDPHETAWEKDMGIFHGHAAIWSQVDQATLPESQEVELAYHPSSMLTQPVRDSPGLKFAKLLSMPFFGSGVVDLGPGAVKRPKYSRSFHMCFFVFEGRVTVGIGKVIGGGGLQGEGGEEGERFSIGVGGMFQVPRGNKYSIANELEKPARLFFSQGCETVAEE